MLPMKSGWATNRTAFVFLLHFESCSSVNPVMDILVSYNYTLPLLVSVGTGILTAADGSVYEGGFHNNLRHGEGVQMYRYV